MNKILVFGMTENPGGVESVIINYYRNIDRTKIQFDFLCNSYEKVAYEDELIELGGRTFHFPARSKNFFKYRKELNKFFVEHASKYQAIWVNVCSLANIDYLKLAKKYNIACRIIHCHNSQNMDGKLRGILHRLNRRKLSQYATDFWTCSSDATEWFFEKQLQSDVVEVHNAIDIDKLSYSQEKREQLRTQLGYEDAYVIGNIGRLHFQKNQTFVLEVFKEVLEHNKNAKLVLVGQGEDESMLKDKAKALGIIKNVHFAGVQYDIQGWLSAFDLFLFPSVFEGLGIAALEAQANGVPVLASDKVIPKEVEINSNFSFISLERSSKEWAKEVGIFKKNKTRLTQEVIEENFTNTGYNIKREAYKLEKLFMER